MRASAALLPGAAASGTAAGVAAAGPWGAEAGEGAARCRRRRRRRNRGIAHRSSFGRRRRARGFEPRPQGLPFHHGPVTRRAPGRVPVETQRRRIGGLTHPPQYFTSRRGHDWQEQHGRDAHRLGHVEQHLAEPAGRLGILGQGPRPGLLDVLVRRAEQPIDRVGAVVQRVDVHRRAIGRERLRGRGGQRSRFAGRRDAPAGVALGHAADPAHQVAEVVGQVGVVALLEALPREVAVAAVRHFLHQVQPQRIRAEPIGGLQRIDRRAERLAHLLALEVDPAVAEHLPRQGLARRHQHRRPHDGVEARDVLADDVQAGRPPLGQPIRIGAVADRGDVVDERVEPHVDDALRIVRHRDAPGLPGAADRDVLEARFEQAQDLVAPHVRLQELGMRREVREQPIAIRRQAEEVVRLADPRRLRAMDRTQPVDQVLLRLERLARLAVPALVEALVEIAVGADLLRHRLHGDAMARLRGADEVVERDVEPRPDVAEDGGHLVAVDQRIEALLARLAVDVQRMLVEPHQEMGLDAAQPLVAGDDVGRDLLVGRAQVGLAVGVVDRGGEEEGRGRHGEHGPMLMRWPMLIDGSGRLRRDRATLSSPPPGCP